MGVLPDSRRVALATINHLESQTGKQIGWADAPDGNVFPYAILNEGTTTQFSGPPMTDPEGDARFIFQITSVGGNPNECGWMAGRIALALVGRAPDGSFLHPFMADGHLILDIAIVTHGFPEHQGDVYVRDDEYAIHVSAT